MIWHVVQTEPQQERLAQDELRDEGFMVYWPHFKVMVRAGRKYRQVTRSLFPGYLFVAAAGRWGGIFSTRGVRGLLMIGDRPAELSEGVLEAVRAVEETEQKRRRRKRSSHDFSPGNMVRVDEGSFGGLSGKIVALDGNDRIKLLLSLFGRLTPVVVSAEHLSKVEKTDRLEERMRRRESPAKAQKSATSEARSGQ